jgi:hypothetical protein
VSRDETVHACPPDGAITTPCCGRTPFELPRTDRVTTEAGQVTCGGGMREARPWKRVGKHFVSGAWVSCCEEGETDCPCVCHTEPKDVPA